jgi:7-cyano-7-deazaguanine synthase
VRSALLLSGGMDSISVAWWKRPSLAITLDYGQLSASAEKAASTAVCRELGIEHQILTIDCRSLGSGDMAGNVASDHAPASDWWPYRNQLLVTLAAMRAITLGVTHLWIGTVASDSTHKDGTTEFVTTLSALMQLQEGAMTVEAPALHMSTVELVKLAKVPEGILAWAHSCHTGDIPCGSCRGCNKYFQTLEALQNGLD